MKDRQITVCPAGGLANRMRAIASAIALGRDTGRPVEIVWARDSGLNAPYSLLFDTSALPVPLRGVGAAAYHLAYEAPRLRNLRIPALITRLRFALSHFDEAGFEDRYVGSPALLRSEVDRARGAVYFFSGLDFYPFSDNDYRRYFRPSPTVSRRLEELAASAPGATVALHIRRSDNLNSIASSPLSLFIDAIEKELAADPDIRFFLATDDDATKAELLSRYPGRIFTNPATACRDTPEGVVDALAEMLLMARMHRIYGSFFSTFSDAAARIGAVPLTICRR